MRPDAYVNLPSSKLCSLPTFFSDPAQVSTAIHVQSPTQLEAVDSLNLSELSRPFIPHRPRLEHRGRPGRRPKPPRPPVGGRLTAGFRSPLPQPQPQPPQPLPAPYQRQPQLPHPISINKFDALGDYDYIDKHEHPPNAIAQDLNVIDADRRADRFKNRRYQKPRPLPRPSWPQFQHQIERFQEHQSNVGDRYRPHHSRPLRPVERPQPHYNRPLHHHYNRYDSIQ